MVAAEKKDCMFLQSGAAVFQTESGEWPWIEIIRSPFDCPNGVTYENADLHTEFGRRYHWDAVLHRYRIPPEVWFRGKNKEPLKDSGRGKRLPSDVVRSRIEEAVRILQVVEKELGSNDISKKIYINSQYCFRYNVVNHRILYKFPHLSHNNAIWSKFSSIRRYFNVSYTSHWHEADRQEDILDM